MSDPRESIQQEAKREWLKKRCNTLILGTGMGKSKVAIDIIKEIDPKHILLLTNSETLRDKNWKAEFEKFGAMGYWENTTSECYQTVFRWTEETKGRFDLVIADEIDFAMTEVYQKFFQNNTYNYLLGLTGFCTDEKRVLLNQYAPICYEYSTQDAQQNGLLNKSEIIFIEYPLSNEKNIKVAKRKGGHFYNSENELYKYYTNRFTQAMIQKTALEKKEKLGLEIDPVELQEASWKYKIMAAKRKSVLNNLDSSVKVVKELVKQIHTTPNNKVVIFSSLIKQGEKMGCTTFNGENDTNWLINVLNLGAVQTMAVCKKLNRGVNLIGVNYIIKESYDGSETDFQQQHGRGMRLRPDQVFKMLILVPYYQDNGKVYTQATRWAKNMTQSFDLTSSRTIQMTEDYKLPANHGL